jgi:hypothetical protein
MRCGQNLNVEMQAKFSQQTTTFKNYDKYILMICSKIQHRRSYRFLRKIRCHWKANATIDPKIQAEAPGMLKASFITKVYEEGGDFSTDVIATTYSPYPTYVGIKS